VARIHQKNIQPALLQDFKHRHPIDPGRLHRHASHSLSNQPVSHPLQIRRKAFEASHWLLIPFRADGHPVLAAPDIDARRIGMNYIQRFPVHFRNICLFHFLTPNSSHCSHIC